MASGLMSIRYSDDGIANRAGDAYRKLNDVRTSLGNIRKKVNGLPERSSRNNLSNASAFITKKTQQYEKRESALQTLQQRANIFTSHVETTENKLSDEIRQSYEAFHQVTGIGKTQIAAIFEKLQGIARDVWKFFTETLPEQIKKTLENFCETLRNIGETIAEWYEKHKEGIKYFLKLAWQYFATLANVAMVALLCVGMAKGVIPPQKAILPLISSIIASADSIIGLIKQGKVAYLYLKGDKAAARELDSMSNAEFLFGADNEAGIFIYDFITAAGALLGLVGGIVGPSQVSTGMKALEGIIAVISSVDAIFSILSGPDITGTIRGGADLANALLVFLGLV